MIAAISMTENSSESGVSAAVSLMPDASFLTAGDLLRQAREAQGIHLDAVAAALKVPVQKIAALESNALDLLPDAVFARALAASMCRALRVDPAPILAKLPSASAAGLAPVDNTINASFRGESLHAGRAGWHASPSLLLVIVLLLLGAVVLYFMPQSALNAIGASLQRAVQRGPVTATGAPSWSFAGPAHDAAGALSEPVAAELPVAPSSESAALAMATAASSPVVSAADVLAAGSEPLVFVARAESWITVTDSHGVALLKRIVAAGETVGVSGALPFSVVVGRALEVDVQLRGQPFDLKPLVGSGGVARFTVRP